MTDSNKTKKGLTRRGLLKAGAAATGAAVGSGLITGFPTIWAQNPITLRQFGTGVSNTNARVRRRCHADCRVDNSGGSRTAPRDCPARQMQWWLRTILRPGVRQECRYRVRRRCGVR